MPLPRTEHFANYASPLKLFEYMASGRALVASDLPSWADVLREGENALLVPPDDSAALAGAIVRLRADAGLRARLAAAAKADAYAKYTWVGRTRMVINAAGGKD
jgi:glycosyltransferase involved in cell wall biosynthesis